MGILDEKVFRHLDRNVLIVRIEIFWLLRLLKLRLSGHCNVENWNFYLDYFYTFRK